MSVQINVQASQTALAQSIAQGVAAFNSRYAGQNQLNLQINARSFSQPLGRITSDLADFESALKASNARVLAFGASTAVLGGVVRSFKEIANVTLEVEKSLTDINRVLNLSTSGLQKFSSELFNVSKQTASSFDDATKAALEFSRQGLNTEETLKRTADALTLVRLTGISSTKAVEDLTATINGFAKAGLTTSQVVNKLAAVEQDFAVSATDLTEALSRTGQAAQEAGVSFDELNALVTTAQQNTARGGAVIGNALKTIFTRLQRTETLDQLENFNIAVRDVQGNILPAVQILKNFADQYNNLADAQRAQLSEQVAGVYQVNILKGVIKDLNNSQGTYVQALERGAMAANEADIANEKLNKTLSALVTQTGVGLQQLANNVGKVTFAPIFEAIVSPVNDAVSYINDTLEGEGIGSIFANGLLKGVRNVIAGPGLAVAFAVIAKVAKNTFEDATKALPAILGLTTEAQKRANIEKSIISILQTQSNLSLALQGQQGNLSTQAATVLNYARLQTAQYQQQLQIAQQLAPLLAAQNVTVGSRGIQVGPKIKAGGHIPAFAEMSERMGAAMGGYKSGKVVKAPTSVGANTYMNSAEEVKYVSGFAQPFINPPANSKAGRKHRQNAINRTGVDPYMASGFIPNFAEKSIKSLGKESLNNLYDVGDRVDNQTYYDKYDDQGLIKMFKLPYTYDEYRLKAAYAFNNALKIYKTQGANGGLENANKYLKNVTGGYAQALEKKYFEEPDTTDAKKHLNKIAGGFAENDTAKIFSKHSKLINQIGPDFSKIIANRVSFVETKVRKNDVSDEVILEKFLRGYAKTSPNSFKRNKEKDVISAKLGTVIHAVAQKSQGFIPNFAPPTSAIRVPWFKKFGNPAFDTIQPTLGISKASDTDTFRSSQFRSKAFEKAATDGDPNLFAPLYEDFIFKALQLVSQPKIKDQLIRGYVNQPGTDQKQSAFDAFLGDVGLEFKGFPKSNLTGSISKNLNDKYERYAKANPTGAAKIKESIIAFNEIGDKNQLPSDFGKNFSQLAGTSYSEMVKNNPDLVKGLSAETNMLLERYVKDPNFLRMNAAGGFIPNFADFIETEIDAILQPISKSRTIQSKQLFGKTLDSAAIRYLNDTSIEKLNKYLEFDGYMEGALGIDFPDRADKKFLFTKNKGFIPNFSQLMKGYAFNDGRIYNDVYHSDAWDSIEGPTTGAIKYANYNGKLVYQAKNISEKLKQAFISRGASVSSFLPVQDVDAALRSGNTKEIQDKSSQLGAVQLSEGIKAIYENGRYTTFIKDNKSLRILGGITPDELKMYGGVDRFLAYHERVHGVQKWQSFANGFIPNFAYIKSMIARVIPNTFRSLTDTKGTAFSNTNIGIARQKSFQSYNLTDEQVLSQAQLNYPNLIMSILGNNAFIPDIDAVDKQSAGAQVYSAANIVSSFGSTTANRSDQYNPFGGGAYKGNPELIGTGSVQGKAIKLSYANVGKLGRRWENSKDPVVKDAWANLQKYAKMKLIYKARTSTGNDGSAFLNENSRRWYKDDIDKELRKYSEILKTEYNNYLKSINRIGTYVDIKGSAEATLFGKDVNYMALRPDVLNKQLQGLPKFDWKNAANGIFYGDYKNNKEKYDRLAELKGKKWTYNNASKRMFLQSGGFIPNFAYKQSVMALEEGMSGKNAILDTTTGPFPFIRNSGQSNFASAISDHGGLKNALNDSMRNQEAAGLMSKGFVPNFATVNTQAGFGLPFGALKPSEQKLFVEMNKALSQLTRDLTLTSQQQNTLRQTILNNAYALQASTGSTDIVTEANKALTASLQQNANAQQKAAAQATQQQAAQQPVQQTLSTRLLGTSRGGKFDKAFGRLSNNIGFNLAAPLLGGIAESFIAGGKDRSEMGYGQRLASSGASAALSGLSTGAAIGSAIPGIGTAAGAAIGALVGFGGAALNAKNSLEDLQKASENYRNETQTAVESGKGIINIVKSLENLDPNSLEAFDANQKLQEYFVKISETGLDQKFKEAGTDIEKMTKAIKDYETERLAGAKRASEAESRKSKADLSIEQLAKKSGLRTEAVGTTKFRQSRAGAVVSYKTSEQEIATTGEAGIANFEKLAVQNSQLFEDVSTIQKAVGEKFPDFVKVIQNEFKSFEFDQDAVKNFLKGYDIQGVDVAAFAETLEIINEESGKYGKVLSGNFFEIFKAIEEGKIKTAKDKAISAKSASERIESVRQRLFRYSQAIEESISKIGIQIENFQFERDFGKLNLEKSAQIINEGLSSISKNIDSAFKNQFDFLVDQTSNLQQKRLLDFEAQNFQKDLAAQAESRRLGRAKELVSVLQTALGETASDQIDTLVSQFRSTGTVDVGGIDIKSFAKGAESKRAVEAFNLTTRLSDEEAKNKEDNARKIFMLEQAYANQSLKLKNETGKLDYDLSERRYKNAVREKELIDSISNQSKQIQIRGQAQIERSRIEADSPYFMLGQSEFTIADEKRRRESIATKSGFELEARQAIADAEIARIQREVLADNTNATLQNTTAIEDLIMSMTSEGNKQFTQQNETVKNLDTQIKAQETFLSLNSMHLPEDVKQKQEKELIDMKAKRESIISSSSYAANKASSEIYNRQMETQIARKMLADRKVEGGTFASMDLTTIKDPIKYLNERSIQEKDILESLEGQKNNLLMQKELEGLSLEESAKLKALDDQIAQQRKVVNDVDTANLTIQEKITTEKEKQNRYDKDALKRGTFTTGVAKAVGAIRSETEMFKETLGTTTVNAFRDGLVGAMDAALNKADDLESALMGIAAGFLREIQGVMLRNIANQLVGSVMPNFGAPATGNQRGGIIRAQSGMYISGGRTGDKNPALLEDGEYVLNRNAVKALGGPRAIDQLNFNAFPRFADGGDPGTMSASVSMGEPFERLSMYGREQSPEYQSYLEKLREAEAARERKRAERKALLNQFIGTLITTGVMAGLTSGVQGLKSKFGSKTPLNKVAGSKPNLAQRAQLKKAGVAIGPDGYPAMQTGGAIGFNQGGFLPYGSRLTDSIPAYLTGGEYVVNSRAVRKYGVGGLNRINSGVARFQDGGMVGDSMSPSSNSSNTSNSNISINITVNANNGKVGDQESDSTGDSTESNSKELSNRIKAVVLDVITTEQRTGGLLDSTKKR